MLKCSECPETFGSNTGALRLHLYQHIGVVPFKCSVCEISAESEKKVQEHIRERHPFTLDANVLVGLSLTSELNKKFDKLFQDCLNDSMAITIYDSDDEPPNDIKVEPQITNEEQMPSPEQPQIEGQNIINVFDDLRNRNFEAPPMPPQEMPGPSGLSNAHFQNLIRIRQRRHQRRRPRHRVRHSSTSSNRSSSSSPAIEDREWVPRKKKKHHRHGHVSGLQLNVKVEPPNNEPTALCQICHDRETYFGVARQVAHIFRVHLAPGFRCTHCQGLFHNAQALRGHTRKRHYGQMLSFIDERCQKRIGVKEKLRECFNVRKADLYQIRYMREMTTKVTVPIIDLRSSDSDD